MRASTRICWSQFWPLEEALVAMGVVVWPMVDVEADDALASGAAVADDDGAWTRSSSARPTRTSVSAYAGSASCSSTGASLW